MKASTIENGRRVPVACTLFTGSLSGGLVETDQGGEFSVPGAIPLGQQAYAGKVDGRDVRILGARPSPSDKSMMIVTFEWIA